jgi:hypothetical protein
MLFSIKNLLMQKWKYISCVDVQVSYILVKVVNSRMTNMAVGRHVATLDTLFWFRANQSLLLHLSAACLAEKQQIPIL